MCFCTISQDSTYHSKIQLIINNKFQKFNESHKDLFRQKFNEIINNYLLTEHKVHLNLISLMQITNVVIEDINVL